ncbi:MAG: cyclase family protein [Proteobacteria bacterium]|nr:cyclase family protein [Pseudomonadota bacterium]
MLKNSKRDIHWDFLSNIWGPECPSYGNGQKITIATTSCLADGGSCNKLEFKASNHDGSHIDFPRHFSQNGLTASDYPASHFVFGAVSLIWFEGVPWGTLIGPEQLEQNIDLGKLSPDTELLLIRTGAGLHRTEPEYWQRGIGLDIGCADFFRLKFPQLRSIGLDTLSLTSYVHRDIGRKVHREFLDNEFSIIVMEDLALECLKGFDILQVIALPLRIANGDGAPCTVIAQLSASV